MLNSAASREVCVSNKNNNNNPKHGDKNRSRPFPGTGYRQERSWTDPFFKYMTLWEGSFPPTICNRM